MKLNIKSLAILLFAQLLVAVGIFYGKQIGITPDSESLVINQPFEEVIQISITSNDDSSVKLLLQDNKWSVANENNFPADSAKISNFLDNISSLSSRPASAVAVTEGARARFKVSDIEFSKQIKLTNTANITEVLFLGSSPALDRVHIRKGGENTIFSVKFPTYEASSSSSNWLDKTILQVPSDSVIQIRIGETILERKVESNINTAENTVVQEISGLKLAEDLASWQTINSAEPSRLLNQDAAQEITKQVERLRFTNLSNDDKNNTVVSEEVLELILQLKDGREIKYIISKSGDAYNLRASNWDQIFSLGSYTAERLIESVSDEVLFPSETPILNEE